MKRFAALLCATSALIAAPAVWAAAPTLESAPSGGANGTTSTPSTVAVTPAGAGFSTSDALIMFVFYEYPSASSITVSSIAQTSQTYVHQWTVTCTPSGASPTVKVAIEEWTAPRVGTVTAAATVTMSAAVDSLSAYITGLVGLHSSSSPRDTNGGLPASPTCAAYGAALGSFTFSTTEANDQLIALGYSLQTSGSAPRATTSTWSVFDTPPLDSNGAHYNTAVTIINHPVTATQSGTTADIAGASSATVGWVGAVDALTADAAPSGTSNQGMTLRGIQ